MSKAVLVLVTRREQVPDVRASIASSATLAEAPEPGRAAETQADASGPVAPFGCSVRHAGEAALEREIVAAHRRVPSAAVVVVAADARMEEQALACGADEVVRATDAATLESAFRRARLRALARDAETPDGRVLAQVLSNVVRRLEAPTTALALDLESFRGMTEAALPREASGVLDDCGAAVEDFTLAIRDAGLFSRADGVELPSQVDLLETAEQVIRVLGGPNGLEAVVEHVRESAAPPAFAPRGRLARLVATAIVHAIASAATHAPPDALLRLRVAARAERADAVVLDLEAIAAAAPFTKRESVEPEGALRLLQEAARVLGGELLVERAEGFARLQLVLPREPVARLSLARPQASQLRMPARPRVLLIDPDERVLRATSRALAEHFEVSVARNGEEAIDAARALALAAVVLNVRLPDVTATLLVEELRAASGSAAAKIVLVAGQGELDRPDAPVGDARVDKPIRRADLLTALEAQLSKPTPPIRGRSSPVLN